MTHLRHPDPKNPFWVVFRPSIFFGKNHQNHNWRWILGLYSSIFFQNLPRTFTRMFYVGVTFCILRWAFLGRLRYFWAPQIQLACFFLPCIGTIIWKTQIHRHYFFGYISYVWSMCCVSELPFLMLPNRRLTMCLRWMVWRRRLWSSARGAVWGYLSLYSPTLLCFSGPLCLFESQFLYLQTYAYIYMHPSIYMHKCITDIVSYYVPINVCTPIFALRWDGFVCALCNCNHHDIIFLFAFFALYKNCIFGRFLWNGKNKIK